MFKTSDKMDKSMKTFFEVKLPNFHRNIQYHAYASYCMKDEWMTKEIIDVLSTIGFKVKDPDRNSTPGRYVLQEIVEFGIDRSQMVVLFITKNYVKNQWCIYEANQAMMKYVKSKGKFRVVPILLENCKCPYYLRSMSCISVWKYIRMARLNPQHRSMYLLNAAFWIAKACLTTTLPFGGHGHYGLKAISHGRRVADRIRYFGRVTVVHSRKMCNKMSEFIHREEAKERFTNYCKGVNVFVLFKLARLIHHSLLHCRYRGCTFHCSGLDFTKFENHLKQCKYITISCKHKGCNVYAKRFEIEKHQKICAFKPIKCQFPGCNKESPLYLYDEHILTCGFRPVPCMYENCTEIPLMKAWADHLMKCEHKPIAEETLCIEDAQKRNLENKPKFKCQNEGCGDIFYTNCELQNHSNTCLFKVFKCPNMFCDYQSTQNNVIQHTHKDCPYRNVKCNRCSRTMQFNYLKQHRDECTDTIVCEKCGRTIKKSNKKNHDRNFCQQMPGLHCPSTTGTTLSRETNVSEAYTEETSNKGQAEYTEATSRSTPTDIVIDSRGKPQDIYINPEKDEESVMHGEHAYTIPKEANRRRAHSTNFPHDSVRSGVPCVNRSFSASCTVGSVSPTSLHEANRGSVPHSPESLEVWRKFLKMIDRSDDPKLSVLRSIYSYDDKRF